MWKSTKMVVLVALTAGVYAAVLIPFKVVPVIPAITEMRPANVLPVVLSLLFGPAAAWGAAFGNLIADFFGTLGPGSIFGFVGNFLYGYIPYRLWRALFPRVAPTGAPRQIPLYLMVTVVASAACSVTICFGLQLLGIAPYTIVAVIIFFNNSVMAAVLGIPLLPLLYRLAKSWGLLYEDIMDRDDTATPAVAPIGGLIVTLGSCAGVALALLAVGGKLQLPPQLDILEAAGICTAAILLGSFLLARLAPAAVVLVIAVGVGLAVAQAPALAPLPGAGGGLVGVAAGLVVLYAGAVVIRRPAAGGVAAPEAETAVARDGRAIELQGVSFTYQESEAPALGPVDFVQRPGEFVALMGRTGAGKSTLCFALNGLVPRFFPGAFGGTVKLHGRDIASRRVSELAQMIGLVFQDFETQLFSSDVESEVAFPLESFQVPREQMDDRVRRALETVNLAQAIGRDPATLSGGEKQRLAIASVLVAEPEILVLDEPTTDLDPVGRADVLAVVAELRAQGKTALMAEHETEEVVGADRLLLLEDGVVAYDGSPDELLAAPERTWELGIRPLDMPALFAAMGREERPLEVEAAAEILRAEGWGADEARLGQVRDADAGRQAQYGDVILSVRDVAFSYDGHRALDGVSLDVQRGEFVAILGQNGCGKTTLAKHLNGLLQPGEGTVLVAGQPSTEAPVAELARTVAYVFQNPDHQIFMDRVEDEVAFGPRNLGVPTEEIGDRVREALEAVDLVGYEGRDPFVLTKGERQRVAVASALAARPQVIILDEPTTGLDGAQQRSMMKLLRRLNEGGHTIIVITHSMWAASTYAHRVVLMSEGGVLADAPVREVFGDAELLGRTSLRQPDICALSSHLCGFTFVTPAEMAGCLKQ
ncbi:MAG: energy-coupling factor transporter ATPase [Armatimonadota bacterium]